jgi:small subunit ribosomal protein S1
MMERELEESRSFAEIFEAIPKFKDRKFVAGETVSGRVVKITKDTIFIDLESKSEAIAEAGEFLDGEGNLTVKEGDRVEMRVSSTREGIHLTKGIKVQGAEAFDILQDAKEAQTPVEGRVVAVNKGGFEIDLSGFRAFCPVSQIDIKYTEKPEEHIGGKYQFRIMEIQEKGKNIVVSRRALLEEEQERKAKETLALLKPDVECEGKVTKVMEFGAFVDLGGVEGMVHVSEISRARIGHPSEVLSPGQSIKVKVLKMDTDKNGRQRIALSMKALEPDQWEKGFSFQEGEIIRGKVSRLTDFGAFVEVAPGVDGLVHISEISYERLSHPNAVLHEGETVEVLVTGIDPAARRIALSIKEALIKKQMGEQQEGPEKARLEVGQVLKGIVEDSKPYGLFVRLPQLGTKVRGLLPMEELKVSEKGDVKKRFPKGKEVQVEIITIDEKGKIRLSQKVMEEREDRQEFEKFILKGKKNGDFGTFGDLFKDLKLK